MAAQCHSGEYQEMIDKVLHLLESWGFVKSTQDDFMSANDMDVKYDVTLTGQRVAELYLDPYTGNKLVERLKKDAEKNSFSYLQAVSHTLEMRPLLRVKKKEQEKIHSMLGNTNLSIQYLSDAFDIAYVSYGNILANPIFDSIRNDERFKKLNYRYFPYRRPNASSVRLGVCVEVVSSKPRITHGK